MDGEEEETGGSTKTHSLATTLLIATESMGSESDDATANKAVVS